MLLSLLPPFNPKMLCTKIMNTSPACLAQVIMMQPWIAASINTAVPSHSGCWHSPLLLCKCYSLPILLTALLWHVSKVLLHFPRLLYGHIKKTSIHRNSISMSLSFFPHVQPTFFIHLVRLLLNFILLPLHVRSDFRAGEDLGKLIMHKRNVSVIYMVSDSSSVWSWFVASTLLARPVAVWFVCR